MATKDQVLKLLEKGLNPQQIAKKLGCKDAYVRAVKAREFGNGKAVARKYRATHESELRAYKSDYHQRRYRTDPDYRRRLIEGARQWEIENPERRKAIWARYRAKRKAEQSQSAN